MAIEIHGFCEERFAPLKEAFAANFAEGLEVGASVAATYEGRGVVDLWAGVADPAVGRPWEKDTIAWAASITKIATAMCLMVAVDRGLVDLDATVATYWPEFAAGGKERVTVREAMSHRAGVPGFATPIPFEALYDWEATCARLAGEPHWFSGESRICYHFNTYGHVLGEILRRVDGRRPGQFFHEEIAQKAGIDFQMGLASPSECDRLAPAILPADPKPPLIPDPLAAKVFASVGPADIGSWEFRRCEFPTGNGYGNGRSIARFMSILALGGELDGVRYLSEAIVKEATGEQASGVDPFVGWMRMGLGLGLHSDAFAAPTPTSGHWGGYGGSIILVDPASRFSFGYVMNKLFIPSEGKPFDDPRRIHFWDALGEVMTGL